MYTPNHAMLVIEPPHGTQLIGHANGSYMFIFDRSLKLQVIDWLDSLVDQAVQVTETAPATVASSETTVPTQGKVLKGDVVFEFAAAPPAKLDETVHVDADVAEAMAEANKRGLHHDTERPPAEKTEPQNPIPELM